ncbi:MAG: hypothetical protein QOE90_3486 [Thermoplasmata archaeon]|jgi:hypothetical protein|nr:hypothetical protein [Thermoplasmata archaeon]
MATQISTATPQTLKRTRGIRGTVACNVEPDAVVLVHVSDIHFKDGSASTSVAQTDVKTQLTKDAAEVCNALPVPAGILVTGDIAFAGQASEYATARSWLEDLCKALKVPSEDVWTIPGNHDVDRSKHKDNAIIEGLHAQLRKEKPLEIDQAIDKIVRQPAACKALLDPFSNYDEFAAGYECRIPSDRFFWEQELPLNDTSMLAIRGIHSALVSTAKDSNTTHKLVVGSLQYTLPEKVGCTYLVMCHHPPNWLLDGEVLEKKLKPRARIHLFGHRHDHAIDHINDSVRISAGALFPDKEEQNWAPRYNIIALRVQGEGANRALHVVVFPRMWNDERQRFVADQSAGTCREFDLPLPPWQAPQQATAKFSPPAPPRNPAPVRADNVSPRQESLPMRDPERRLTYRFLSLPFDKRFKIASSLGLVEENDREANETERAARFFSRARQRRLLAQLWDAVENEHKDAARNNPFKEGGS